MTVKKKRTSPPPKLAKAKPELPPKLSKTEADLLWHMAHGYQLETSSRWDNPILRNLKDNTEGELLPTGARLRHCRSVG
jgi:hypothetical protein